MRFHIDLDAGDRILGWVVPDNPIRIGRVIVASAGRRIAEVEAKFVDPMLREQGWHSTGQCRFVVTEEDVPNLSRMPRLEIYESDTNVLVYRRCTTTPFLPQRLFVINTSINPENILQHALFPHFRQNYFGLERMTEDTLQCVFGDVTIDSSLISGAVVVPRYGDFLVNGTMLTATILHDPHVEMATRLLWLKERAAMAADPQRSWRLGKLGEAALFTEGYDLTKQKDLRRYFRMLPEPAYHFLYNPLTRQFGTRMPDDRVQPGNSLVAMELLARVDVVGHASYFGAFMESLYDRLGIAATAPQAPPVPAATRQLADLLRTVKDVEEMLVFDVALADTVEASVSKHWS